MTPDEVLEAACLETGLSEFHSNSWREGLEILCEDHAKVGLLNEVGKGWYRQLAVSGLATRLRIDDHLRKHPKILDTPIKRPVFILGMPRTGTTLLSYMMDADPSRRSFLKWEAYNIVPPAAAGALRTDPRCLEEKAKDAIMLERARGQAAMHFEAADGPTECVHLMAHDFKSLMLAVTSTAPTYEDWILFCDTTPAMAHRKRALQILQTTNPGAWTLKMPSDSLFIRALFRTFPDAKIIWTHRDPYVATSSIFNMRGTSRANFMAHSDADHMRAQWPLQLALHVTRPLEVSKERPDDFYHLYYDEMMADPIGQIRKIYAWLGDDYSHEAEMRMRAWLEENPQGKFGTHTYSLAKWGLSKHELEPYFSDYLREHPVATGKEV